MLVVSDHIMKFGRERAAGKLHRPGEVAQDRLHAAVSPRTSSSFGWVLLPASAGVAILRYRLYDIDRLINRTLVYGLLTANLGLGYAGAVLVLGHLFGGIRGEPPSWVVVGATLAVAALFQPARRRIQSIVDRRFNRRKYDAAKTVKAFSARLRDQLDLDTLSIELLAVVDETVQPAKASIWLRPPSQVASHSQGRAS